MKKWKKNSNPDEPDIWVYGDGEGEILYRLYELHEEEDLNEVQPKVVFIGDSEMPDPTFDEIKELIESSGISGDDLVLCTVTSNGKNSKSRTMEIRNGKCYWKV